MNYYLLSTTESLVEGGGVTQGLHILAPGYRKRKKEVGGTISSSLRYLIRNLLLSLGNTDVFFLPKDGYIVEKCLLSLL